VQFSPCRPTFLTTTVAAPGKAEKDHINYDDNEDHANNVFRGDPPIPALHVPAVVADAFRAGNIPDIIVIAIRHRVPDMPVSVGQVLEMVNLALFQQEVHPHGPDEGVAPAVFEKPARVIQKGKKLLVLLGPEKAEVQNLGIVPVVTLGGVGEM